ncbi:hypothetical protein ACHQM5_018112 [Ranunculus cassubicifolius]
MKDKLEETKKSCHFRNFDIIHPKLAIVGRPNVGKSTLLNAILQQERVLVGPEADLTRDSVRADFKYQGRTIYLVDTAGWLDRTKQVKGPASLSIMQSRQSLLRAHVIALVLDGEEIANAKSSMKHSEVVIARRAVEGRSLVVIVNKMDLLQGDPILHEKVLKAVPEEIQTVIPQGALNESGRDEAAASGSKVTCEVSQVLFYEQVRLFLLSRDWCLYYWCLELFVLRDWRLYYWCLELFVLLVILLAENSEFRI